MQCIAAIACLKHAIQKLWNIQIYMRHTVGWNKHFLSANLLLRFLLCDKGNAIFISGLYVSGTLSNYKRWPRLLAIKAHIAAGNNCEDCFSKGCHIESNRCTWLEKRFCWKQNRPQYALFAFFRKSMTHKTPDIRTLFFSHTPVVKYKLLVVLLQLLWSFSHKQAMSETFFHHNSLWERGVQNSLNFHYQPFGQLLQFPVKLGKHDLFGKSSTFCVEQGCATFFVGGPYNQLQTSSWATRKI